MHLPPSAEAGVQPLRAPRANPVCRTDEKHLRSGNSVMDKDNIGSGLSLYRRDSATYNGFGLWPYASSASGLSQRIYQSPQRPSK